MEMQTKSLTQKNISSSFGSWSASTLIIAFGLIIYLNNGDANLHQKVSMVSVIGLMLVTIWLWQISRLRTNKLLLEQKRLIESEERYRKLVELSPLAVFVQIESQCIFSNASGIKLLGYKSVGEILGKDIISFVQLLPDPELIRYITEGEEIRYGEEPTRIEGQIIRPGGKIISVVLVATSFRYRGKKAVQIIVRDVTERRKVIKALRESEEQYRTLFERTGNPVLVIDMEGHYIDCNQAALDFLKCSKEEVLSKKVGDFNPPGTPIDSDNIKTKSLWENGGSDEVPYYIDGETKFLELTITPVTLQGRQVVYGVGKDITDRKLAEEKIRYLAYHDSLTGLPNRQLFIDRLQCALKRAARNNGILAVLFIDLDFFKSINDSFGHSAGDKLLKEIAGRLKTCVREADTLARPGGDEFTVLLDGIANEEDAIDVANRIITWVKRPLSVEGVEFCITPSIGIAFFPHDGTDTETLLKNADTAMYRAKDQGRNMYQLYTASMQEKNRERIQKETRLHQALEQEEFVLHYQPQFDLKTGRIIGVEALLRWQHPELGLVPPMEFIPLAEETGVIIPLGEWVLRTACMQNKEWQDQGLMPMRVAVNISPKQFQQNNFTERVAKILEDTELSPKYLELEITESVAMKTLDYTRAVVQELKRMGIHISIDDFGSGYSSLGYLKNFPPIDRLKIDKSFVQDISEDANKQVAVLVSTIISMARKLKIDVIAEGVESTYQAAFLKKQRCHKIQGFLFSKPLPAKDLEAMLKGTDKCQEVLAKI